MQDNFKTFVDAIDHGDFETVKRLIDKVDFKKKDPAGNNVMHYVAGHYGCYARFVDLSDNSKVKSHKKKVFLEAPPKYFLPILVVFTEKNQWVLHYYDGKKKLCTESKLSENLLPALNKFKKNSEDKAKNISESESIYRLGAILRTLYAKFSPEFANQNAQIKHFILEKLGFSDLRKLLKGENKNGRTPLELALDLYDSEANGSEINLCDFLREDKSQASWEAALLENVTYVFGHSLAYAERRNDSRFFERMRKIAEILWDKGWYFKVFDDICKKDKTTGGPSFFEKAAVYPGLVKSLLMINEKEDKESKGPQDRFIVKDYDVLKLKTSRGSILHAMIYSYILQSCEIVFKFAAQCYLVGRASSPSSSILNEKKDLPFNLFLSPVSDEKKDLPLHVALDQRSLRIVESLLKCISWRVPIGLNEQGASGFLPIQLALIHSKLTSAIIEAAPIAGDEKSELPGHEALNLSMLNKFSDMVLHTVVRHKSYASGNLILERLENCSDELVKKLLSIGDLYKRTAWFIFHNTRSGQNESKSEEKFGDKLESLYKGTNVQLWVDYFNLTPEEFKERVFNQPRKILIEARSNVLNRFVGLNIFFNMASVIFSTLMVVYKKKDNWDGLRPLFFSIHLLCYILGLVVSYLGVEEARKELNEAYEEDLVAERPNEEKLGALKKPDHTHYRVGLIVSVTVSVALELTAGFRSTFDGRSKEAKLAIQASFQAISPFITGVAFLLIENLLENEAILVRKIKIDRYNKLFSHVRDEYVALKNQQPLIKPLMLERSSSKLF